MPCSNPSSSTPYQLETDPTPPNPFEESGFLSKLSWRWVGPIIKRGGHLEAPELLGLSDWQRSENILEHAQRLWDEERSTGRENLLMVWWHLFAARLARNALWVVIEETNRVIQAVMVGLLVRFFSDLDQDRDPAVWKAWLWCAILGVTAFMFVVTHHQYFFHGGRIGMDMKAAGTGLVYNKLLKLPVGTARQEEGKMSNLISTDFLRFEQLSYFLVYIFIAPVQTGVVVWLLWRTIGASCLAGIACMALMIPIQSLFGKRFGELRAKTAEITDERVRLCNEMFSGIRIVKIFGWEPIWKKIISDIRQVEFNTLRQSTIIRSLNFSIFNVAALLISCCTFVVYAWTGHSLTTEQTFTTISLFNVIRIPATLFFPLAVEVTSEIRVTMQRLKAFLILPELQSQSGGVFAKSPQDDKQQPVKLLPSPVGEQQQPQGAEAVTSSSSEDEPWSPTARILKHDPRPEPAVPQATSVDITEAEALRSLPAPGVPAAIPPNTDLRGYIKMENVCSSWTGDFLNAPTLSHVTAEVLPGTLLAVVGPVGSSKSSLLMAILGELPLIPPEELPPGNPPPKITVKGRIAYCAQNSWIMPGTIRSNVLAGLPYEEQRFKIALRCTALEHDLELFPAGEFTEIGERGVTLSGGQRARLSLARAVYSDADVILLDDPLSAVDAAVARHIFQQCILGVLGNKVRVLVTHQTQFLRSMAPKDRVMIMESGGKVTAHASVQEVMDRLMAGVWRQDDLETESSEQQEHQRNEDLADEEARRLGAAMAIGGLVEPESKAAEEEEEEGTENGSELEVRMETPRSVKPDESVGKLVQAEDVTSGSVTLETYVSYLRAGAGFLFLFWLMILGAGGQTFQVMTELYVAQWSAKNDDVADRPNVDDDYHARVFLLMVLGVTAVALYRGMAHMLTFLEASRVLHNTMLQRVLRAPQSFFSSNPIGRILNRFSNDTGILDVLLPLTVTDFVTNFYVVMGSIVLSSVANPVIIAALVPMLIYFVYLRQTFVRSSRQVKRLEAVSRSPLHSHISMSTDGLISIRALRLQPFFLKRFHIRQNANSRGFYTFIGISRWMASRLDFLSASFMAVVCFGAVAMRSSMDPATIGLAIVYSVNILSMFQWNIRQSVETENFMTSAERVLTYARLPSEPPLKRRADSELPADWPQKGHIVLNKVWLAYKPFTLDWLKPEPRKRRAIRKQRRRERAALTARAPKPGRNIGGEEEEGEGEALVELTTITDRPAADLRLEMETSEDEEDWDLEHPAWELPEPPRTLEEYDEQQRLLAAVHHHQTLSTADTAATAATATTGGGGDEEEKQHLLPEGEPGPPAADSDVTTALALQEAGIAVDPEDLERAQEANSVEWVLKDITLDIPPRSTVGIVGRSGAGKSSTLQALLRLEPYRGEILIDGVDISRIGLHALRGRGFSVIPQEPFLLTMTLRENLDPMEQLTDDEVWSVLRQVQLYDLVRQFPEQLATPITSGGDDLFSAGEKQLICLARALARKVPILILDEATANVDHQTDLAIQRVLQTVFEDATVLIVAHRLSTIIQADYVCVVHDGRVAEFDHPYLLLTQYGGIRTGEAFERAEALPGHFQSMVKQTGARHSRKLFESARDAYIAKFGDLPEEHKATG